MVQRTSCLKHFSALGLPGPYEKSSQISNVTWTRNSTNSHKPQPKPQTHHESHDQRIKWAKLMPKSSEYYNHLDILIRWQSMIIWGNFCQDSEVLAKTEEGSSFHRNPQLLHSKVENVSLLLYWFRYEMSYLKGNRLKLDYRKEARTLFQKVTYSAIFRPLHLQLDENHGTIS
jgi:hypothetical protein